MTHSGEFKPISIENLNLGSAGDFSEFFQIYMAIIEKSLTACEFEFKPHQPCHKKLGSIWQ
jgi:hypothetical protein